MKYENTLDPNIKRHKPSKIYYYRRGEIEKSLKTTDWAAAVLRKKLLFQDIEFSGEVAYRHTVGELYPEYLDEKKHPGVRDKKLRIGSIREIEYIFETHLLPFFQKKKLIDLSPKLWVKYCRQCTVSDLANHRKVTQGFLTWCVRSGFLKNKPDISYLPDHTRRSRRIIKATELEKIFKHAHGSLLLFLSLALFNGLRRTEIMTLTKDRIHLKDRYIIIPKRHNKRHRMRSVPINSIIASLLKKRLENLSNVKTKWVFPNAVDASRHADLSGLKTAWRTTKKNAGISDITWHDFRATFEKYMNKLNQFTEMQKEKFADASMDVQKRIYVNMDHEDLRGLEKAVHLPQLRKIIGSKDVGLGKIRGIFH